LHREQVDKIETRIRLVDVMEDEVGLLVEQALPGAGDSFEMEMQPGARAAVEESPQQLERLGKRTEVADDDP
jgi:hypothetical protein